MRVYMDNAATTPLDKEVAEAMYKVMINNFGNPSSIHSFGRESKALLETSRRTIAKHINASPSEIYFTSGGTEADNMALLSAVENMGVKRIISSPLEHHAVTHTVEYYMNKGIAYESIKLLPNGHVDLEYLEELLKKDVPTIVSLMHGNNEIGNLLPVKKVSEMCKAYNALFHSDTVQTMCHYRFDVKDLDVDFMACSAHKFHGPKGIGFLYAKKGTQISSLIHGGAQERGKRSGTENLYGIVGLAKAMDVAFEDLESHAKQVSDLKQYMAGRLEKEIPGVEFNGDSRSEGALYTVLSVKFPSTDFNDMFLYQLDLNGIAASGGSACSSGASTGSHVLAAIGSDQSRPNIRFSFSKYNTKEEVDYVIDKILSLYA